MFDAELFIIIIIIFLRNLAVLSSGEFIRGCGRGWLKQMEEKISGEGPRCYGIGLFWDNDKL